jgi:hypothetical protein
MDFPTFAAELRAELKGIVAKAIDENPYGFIVAIEPDEDNEKRTTDRGNHERQSDNSGA